MDTKKFDAILAFIRSLYPNENPVPLHAPRFLGNEKKYLNECIDSTYVSYVGRFVAEFEEHIKRATELVKRSPWSTTSAASNGSYRRGIKPGKRLSPRPDIRGDRRRHQACGCGARLCGRRSRYPRHESGEPSLLSRRKWGAPLGWTL